MSIKEIRKAERKIEDLETDLINLKRMITKDIPEAIEFYKKLNNNDSTKTIKMYEKDLKRSKKEIIANKESLKLAKKEIKILIREEKKKRQKEMSVKAHTVIVEFLKQWRESAKTFYVEQLEIMSTKTKEERKKLLTPQGRWLVHLLEKQPERFESLLDDEMTEKRRTLIAKVEKYGKIKNTRNLKIGLDGNINGYVTCQQPNVKVKTIYSGGYVACEKTNVEIRTIYAGGYNIQCLHYRVLVKEL